MITVRSKKDLFFKQEPHARANVSFDQNHLCKLTVENDPSPKIFPNLKSSGLFFLIGWDDVDDNDGEAGDWGEDDEEFGVACFSKSKKKKTTTTTIVMAQQSVTTKLVLEALLPNYNRKIGTIMTSQAFSPSISLPQLNNYIA